MPFVPFLLELLIDVPAVGACFDSDGLPGHMIWSKPTYLPPSRIFVAGCLVVYSTLHSSRHLYH
jgi:hypothetical protein